MILACSQREVVNEHGSTMDALERDYVSYYSSLGMDLVPIPNDPVNAQAILVAVPFDGVLLTGGGDIPLRQRDATEEILLYYALERHLPILGECRGAQFLNIFFGGSLRSHLQRSLPNAINHVRSEHALIIAHIDGLPLTTEAVIVNSFHQHGMTLQELAPELRAFATTEDGVVEGFVHPTKRILGIMWHPERGEPHPYSGSLISQLFSHSSKITNL